MFRKKISVVILICLLIITCFTNASVVLAAGGAGSQASSPGIPGQKPLSYLGTILVDGGEKVDNATDIPLYPKLKMEFDKNVVNSLFWTNNSQCFSMKSSNNEDIPLNVTKIDDTVDFSQRQYIFAQPVNPLQPGTAYQLIISPKLAAKNGFSILGGTTNGQGVTVSFKTVGESVQKAPATDVSPASQPATASATSTPPPTTTASNATNSNNGKPINQNTVNPSSTENSTKSSDSSDIQNQAVSAAGTPNSSASPQPKPKLDEQTTQGAVAQSTNEAKKGGGISGTTWLTIIGAVLLVAWIAVEIIARKRKSK